MRKGESETSCGRELSLDRTRNRAVKPDVATSGVQVYEPRPKRSIATPVAIGSQVAPLSTEASRSAVGAAPPEGLAAVSSTPLTIAASLNELAVTSCTLTPAPRAAVAGKLSTTPLSGPPVTAAMSKPLRTV